MAGEGSNLLALAIVAARSPAWLSPALMWSGNQLPVSLARDTRTIPIPVNLVVITYSKRSCPWVVSSQ